MDVILTADEWHPVYFPEPGGYVYTDLPDDVVTTYLVALDAFGQALSDLRVAMQEAKARAEAEAHRQAIHARRAERGQRKPKRRARPTA